MRAACLIRLLAVVGVIALPVLSASAKDQPRQLVDTREVPRVDGASEPTHSTSIRTNYVVKGGTLEIGDALHRKLTEAGWQRMPHPIERPVRSPSLIADYYKKAPFWVHIYVKRNGAGSDEVEIIYQTQWVKDDVTPPADAADIRFNPHKPHFVCTTALSVDEALAHFEPQLTAKDWKQIDMNRQTQGGDGKATRIAVTYEGDSDKKLALEIRRQGDGRTLVEFKPWEAPKPAPAPRGRTDDTAALFESLVREQLRVHQQPAKSKSKAADAASGPVEALAAKADGTLPLPVPETAEEIKHGDSTGSLEFTTTSSVPSVAAFYRQQMKRLGWRDKPSVINTDRMVVLNYDKSGKAVVLTVMKFGEWTRVSASGSALSADAPPKAASKERQTPPSVPSAPAPKQQAAPPSSDDLALDRLEVEDRGGLVVPKPHSQVSATKTLFRNEATATVQATVETLLAFYRRELAARGWKEQPGASVGPDEARVAYETPDGSGSLSLTRGDPATSVELQSRRTRDAEKAGMLPKPGQAKLMLANTVEKECVVGIGKREVRVKPGAGTTSADGPTFDLPPGTHKVTFKSCIGPPRTEDVTLPAGETWGLMIGPRGGLALPVY